MKNAWNQLKQFFRIPAVRPDYSAGDGFAETAVVDLKTQKKDYVNLQTHRLLLRKRAQAYHRTGQTDWTQSLPYALQRGSDYAVYSAR